MVPIYTNLKPLSHFSPFVKQHNPRNNNALSTHNSTNSFWSKRGGSVSHRKHMVVAVYNAPDQVESSSRRPLSEVVVVRKKRSFWERSWTSWDVSITLSYHRNLSHRSFDLPKWLEYLFAYGGVLAFQGDPIEWVSNHRYHHKHCETQRDPHSPTQGFWFSHMVWIFDTGSILEKCGGEENVDDLVRQPFYRFLQRTVLLHMMAYSFLFYFYGGMPLLVWGIGVAIAVRLHLTFLVNSVCHIWGTRAWNTPDFSKNNLWVAILTLGEGWHNNHQAFEFSARHGLEWWQLDITWCLIRILEAIGLATNVKLPTETQKKKMNLV